jgi:pyrroloquinoline quinone biosynthesis protein D
MAQPDSASRPRLASGCRWGSSDGDAVVLFPEGAIRLQGPGLQILEQCDGSRSFQEIVKVLQGLYSGPGMEQIWDDVAAFLEELKQQRIVDY